jgi:hypothetical protein
MTPEQKIAENLIEISKRIAFTTPPLYVNGSSIPELVSSSILLKWEQNYFLVTCAHTLRRYKPTELGLIFNRTFLTLGGQPIITKSDNIDTDKIDIGVYHLDEVFLEKLDANFFFYDLKNFDFDYDDTSGDDYLVVGYPITRAKVRPDKNKILLRPFLFKTNLSTDTKLYIKTHTRPDANFLLNYQKKKIKDLIPNNIVKGPEPNGLSGCGVWKITQSSHEFESIIYHPIGIIIEYYREHNILIGTRLRVITECLRQAFNIDIPTSKKVKVNIS